MEFLDSSWWQGKHVLILGATGFIGIHLTRTLLKLHASVTATGRSEQSLTLRFTQHTIPDELRTRLTLTTVDVTRPLEHQLPDTRFDVIIHAASGATPASFDNDPVGVMQANIQGTNNVLEYALRLHSKQKLSPVRTLYISSGEVYGLMNNSHLVTENEQGYIDPLTPRSCYPQAKRAAETLCTSYGAQYGIDIRIARLAHVFGPGFTQADNRVSAQFFRDAIGHNNIRLQSSGTQYRTFTYIDDCISAILAIVSRGKAGQAYNVANSDNNGTLHDFAQAICTACNVRLIMPEETQSNQAHNDSCNTIQVKSATPIIRASSLSDHKLRKLGWKPTVSIPDGVYQTVTALQSQTYK